jgi:hypothetical protein
MNIDLAWAAGTAHKIQQKESEWKWLLSKCEQHQVRSVLEIGCYSGGGTFSFATFVDRLISVDIARPMFDTSKVKCNFNYVRGDSSQQDTANKVATLLGQNKMDLLFIDGCHSYHGVKRDFELYSKFASKLVAFHDIVDSEFHRSCSCLVSKFWEEIKNKYESDEIIERHDWGGIGVLEVL